MQIFLIVVALLAITARANDEKSTSASSSASAMTVTNPTATSASTASAPTSQVVETNFPREAPTVFAPSADSTSSCRNAISAGGSFLTGGAGVGFSRRDSECEKRAAAEAFLKIGDQEDAFFLLCELKVARHLESCKRNWPPESVRRKK